MNKEAIKELGSRTGEGLRNCKFALDKTEGDIDVAEEYLRLLSQPVIRKKCWAGFMIHWTDDDYLKEAKRIVSERAE